MYRRTMSEPVTISRVIDRLVEGTIRVPGFQRKFVWDPSRVALLMDSIYKSYPIGSVLLWRTQTRLKTEKRLGIFELPPPDRDYPVDYVLDGQQRLTSIFTTFQTSLEAGEPDPDVWLPIYYDFEAEEDAQDSRFVALGEDATDVQRYFPLRVFLDPVGFSKAAHGLPDERHEEIAKVQQRFLGALIPVETFETEDRTKVAIVFERVNRMGIELDVFQLLTAWTWSEDFDLQEQFAALADEFADFGFGSVGSDIDLMLRCCSAVLQRDPSPSALVNLNGGQVRDSFDAVANALRRAIDFLRTEFHVGHIKFLPYEAMLIPLTAFFSINPNVPITGDERAELSRWFWRCSLSHRYSGNPQRNIKRDIEEAVALRTGKSSLADIPCFVSPYFFQHHQFSIRTVSTKTTVLMLARLGPKSLLSGAPVRLDRVLAEPNRSEFHHCFPRAFLRANGYSERFANALANFAIISRQENRVISDKAPSEYRYLMSGDVDATLSAALIPNALFEDNYDEFIAARADLLSDFAASLID